MQNFMMILLLCSITMSLIALLYILLTPLLKRRYSEKGRYYVWLVIVIGFVVPFRPQFENAIFNIERPLEVQSFAMETDHQGIPDLSSENDAVYYPNHQPLPDHTVLAPIGNVINNEVVWGFSLGQVAFSSWLIGVVGVILYHGSKHYKFIKLARRWSENVVDEEVNLLFNRVVTDMNLDKDVALYLCPCIGSPMLVGLFRPRILLPTIEMDADDLYFILKHELIHFRRKDILYKHLVLAATAIHWFNPIIYLMTKSINILGEMSCDTEVVRDMDVDDRQQYSEAIINVIRNQSKLKTALSTNFYGGKREMKRRILSIKEGAVKKWGVLVLSTVFLLTVGTGFLIAFGNSYVPNVEEPSLTEVETEAPTEAPTLETEPLTQATTEPSTEAPTEIETEVPTEVEIEVPTEAPAEVEPDTDLSVNVSPIVGTWRRLSLNEYDDEGNLIKDWLAYSLEQGHTMEGMNMVLHSDGTAGIDGSSEWQVSGNELILIFGGVSVDRFTYSIVGDTLMLTAEPSMGNQHMIHLFTRVE